MGIPTLHFRSTFWFAPGPYGYSLDSWQTTYEGEG